MSNVSNASSSERWLKSGQFCQTEITQLKLENEKTERETEKLITMATAIGFVKGHSMSHDVMAIYRSSSLRLTLVAMATAVEVKSHSRWSYLNRPTSASDRAGVRGQIS